MLHRDFEANGWVMWPDVDLPSLPALQAEFDRAMATATEADLRQGTARTQRFGAQLIKVVNAHEINDVLCTLILQPALAMQAAALMGWDECYLLADSLYYKHPLSSERAVVGFHQDLKYWPQLQADADVAVTAVVPLYDANVESGGLGFVSGSHKWGLLGGEAWAGEDNEGPHGHPEPPYGAEWVETYPRVRAGAATFHHALTFHGSRANRTPQARRSITIHYTRSPLLGRKRIWTA